MQGQEGAANTIRLSKFNGKEHDAETGHDHSWFRQYSSVQVRWTSPDPFGRVYL